MRKEEYHNRCGRHVRPESITYVDAGGTYVIQEKSAAGRGRLTLNFAAPAIACKPPDTGSVVAWLKIQKRPDGLVLECLPSGGIAVHIIELKSKMNESEFRKMSEQSAAGLLFARMLNGLLQSGQIEKHTVYLAYDQDAVTPGEGAAPILLKALPGYVFGDEARRIDAWEKDEIILPELGTFPLRKIVRDGDGNAELAL